MIKDVLGRSLEAGTIVLFVRNNELRHGVVSHFSKSAGSAIVFYLDRPNWRYQISRSNQLLKISPHDLSKELQQKITHHLNFQDPNIQQKIWANL